MPWWSSSQQTDVKAPLPEPVQDLNSSKLNSTQSNPSNTPNSTSVLPAAAPAGRDQQAYEELKGLFASVDPERAAAAATRARELQDQGQDDYSDSIYASTMSCSNCFDQAFYCSSIGGQLNSVYRYGALRSCSDLWAQWRFCMRTKVMSEDTRKENIREFNMKKAVKYKVGRSSEDIWEVRTEPVEHPFSPAP